MDLTNIDPFSMRPKNWQDFERLCCDLWRTIWKDPHAQLHGREGQSQNGVDIYTSPEYEKGCIGIQCKGRNSWKRSGELTINEIEEEVNKAKKFYPKLKTFLLVYTGSSDTKLQHFASEITEKHTKSGFFSVQVVSWTEIWSLLLIHKEVLKIHYEFLFIDQHLHKRLDFIDAKFERLSSQIESLVSLISKKDEVTLDMISKEGQNVIIRFLSIFNEHRIPKPLIPEILEKFSITFLDLYLEKSLLSKLNDDVLSFIQSIFYVNKHWILTGEGNIYHDDTFRNWYKTPQLLIKRLLELNSQGKMSTVIFVSAKESNFEKAYTEGDSYDTAEYVGVLVEIHNISSSGIEFSTYEKWDFERWNYWKTRRYLKVLIMFLEKVHDINGTYWFRGLQVKKSDFDKLNSYGFFPASILKKPAVGSVWYPEDYVNDSYTYVKETDELHLVRQLYNQEKMDDLLPFFRR